PTGRPGGRRVLQPPGAVVPEPTGGRPRAAEHTGRGQPECRHFRSRYSARPGNRECPVDEPSVVGVPRGARLAFESHSVTGAGWRQRADSRPICALILVDCMVMEAAPNGLICMGQQLAGLKLRCRTGDRGSNGVSGPITPGVMAWPESWRDDRDAGSPVSVPGWPGDEWRRRRAGAGSPAQLAPSRSFRAVVRGRSGALAAGAVLALDDGYRLPLGKPGAGGERSIEVVPAQLLADL